MSSIHFSSSSSMHSISTQTAHFSSSIRSVFEYAKSFFIENSKRRELLNTLDKHLADPEKPIERQVYYREFKNIILNTRRGEDPTSLETTFKETSNEYKTLIERSEEIVKLCLDKRANMTCEDVDKYYKEITEELKTLQIKPITETQRALYTGKITDAFRKIDNIFAEKRGKPLHRYCGCHILEEGKDTKKGLKTEFTVAYPQAYTHDPLSGAAVFQQNGLLKKAYDETGREFIQRFSKLGMHSYHVEANQAVLKPVPLTRGVKLTQYLLSNNSLKTFRFINWLFRGTLIKEYAQAIEDQFIRSVLERGSIELQVTHCGRHTQTAIKAAEKLGVTAICGVVETTAQK